MLFAAVRWSLLAHRVISLRCKIWSLLDQSGQRWILARGGLSAFDQSGQMAGAMSRLVQFYQ
jgi:hypothetical protein